MLCNQKLLKPAQDYNVIFKAMVEGTGRGECSSCA